VEERERILGVGGVKSQGGRQGGEGGVAPRSSGKSEGNGGGTGGNGETYPRRRKQDEIHCGGKMGKGWREAKNANAKANLPWDRT